ncbi:hypothetical protein GPALN_003470 [Globodera pallida]|nr:hypothetical protein GPALN_003470 [Globodera pallida]
MIIGPALVFLFLFSTNIRCEDDDIPMDGPDPEVDEHIRQHFQGHMDAFSSGMKEGLAEIQKESDEKLARGEKDPGNLADLIKPENVAKFVSNWLPERIRVLLPKEWLQKLIKALTTESGAIAELYGGAERIGSADEFWRELRKKAPTTAELLEDAWGHVKKSWDKFNRMLNEESKQYVEKVKISGWEWFVRQVAGKFLRLSNEAKTNLTMSLFEAYPLLNTVLSKAMSNRMLLEWAGEQYKKADEQLRAKEQEKSAMKEEFNEESMMAQMKEMFKKMNFGEFDDIMGGMDEEEEGEKEEKGDEETITEQKGGKEVEVGAETHGEQQQEGQCSKSDEGQCEAKETTEKAEEELEKNAEETTRDEL